MSAFDAPIATLAGRLLQIPGGLEDVSEAVTERSFPLGPVLIAGGLLLAVLAVRSLWHRLGGRPVPTQGRASGTLGPGAGPSPLRIAMRICQQRQVSWAGRLLLWRIARRCGLEHPLPLLAASGTLYHHGRQYAAGRPANRRRRVLRGVSRLQRELFGEGRRPALAPTEPAPSAAPPPDRRARPRRPSPQAVVATPAREAAGALSA